MPHCSCLHAVNVTYRHLPGELLILICREERHSSSKHSLCNSKAPHCLPFLSLQFNCTTNSPQLLTCHLFRPLSVADRNHSTTSRLLLLPSGSLIIGHSGASLQCLSSTWNFTLYEPCSHIDHFLSQLPETCLLTDSAANRHGSFRDTAISQHNEGIGQVATFIASLHVQHGEICSFLPNGSQFKTRP